MHTRRSIWFAFGTFLLGAACSCAHESARLSATSPQLPIDCRSSQSNDLLGRPGVVSAVVAEHEREPRLQNARKQLLGAKVMLTPEPGTSHVDLGYTLQCRIARRAQRTSTPDDRDPLAVGHVQVEVSETEKGFMVLILSPYEREAQEVLRRANSLLAKATLQSNAPADSIIASSR